MCGLSNVAKRLKQNRQKLMSLRHFGVKKKDKMDHLSSKHFSNEVDLAHHLKLGHLIVNEKVSQI